MTRKTIVGLAVIALTTYGAGCGSNGSSTQPTNTTAPTQTTFSLSGAVTDGQTGAGIAGALAKIADGPNANKSATADGLGHYRFSGLAQSGFTVNFSAQFYNPGSQGVTLTSNQIVNAALTPIPLFTQSGVGNTVFNVPATVSTLRITGTYTGFTTNFVVWIGPAGSACGQVINGNCRLLVNDLLGTAWGKNVFGRNISNGRRRPHTNHELRRGQVVDDWKSALAGWRHPA